MDLTAEKKESEKKKESENNNNNINNPESAHQLVDSSSPDSNNKEIEERQARELKAGLHPLKVPLSLSLPLPIFHNQLYQIVQNPNFYFYF